MMDFFLQEVGRDWGGWGGALVNLAKGSCLATGASADTVMKYGYELMQTQSRVSGKESDHDCV